MAYSTDLRLAQDVAIKAHRDQVDKAGKPYITHPERVAACMDDDAEKVVAWLHDTVEDTSIQLQDIESLFGPETADAINAITRRHCENWDSYLQRVRENEVARRVKIRDLIDNSNLARLPKLSYADVLRQQKYNKALLYLCKQDEAF